MSFTPVCGKCGNTQFEMKEFEPQKSNYKYLSIQCTKCGVPIGVQEYFNVGFLVKKLAKALNLNI
jgi:hypothetical protein